MIFIFLFSQIWRYETFNWLCYPWHVVQTWWVANWASLQLNLSHNGFFHWKISDMECFCKYFCDLNLKYVFTPVIKLGVNMRYSWTTARFVFKKRTQNLLSDFKDDWNQISEPYFAGLRLDEFSLRRLLLSLNLWFCKLGDSDLESAWIKIPKMFLHWSSSQVLLLLLWEFLINSFGIISY